MGREYTVVETAARARLLEYFTNQLSSDRIQAGDLDKVVHAISEEDQRFGCLLEYANGRDPRVDTNTRMRWTWFIAGVFLVRYSATIEADLRTILDMLPQVFDEDQRLGGVCSLAKITTIDMAETIEVNDQPYYWLPFVMEFWMQ